MTTPPQKPPVDPVFQGPVAGLVRVTYTVWRDRITQNFTPAKARKAGVCVISGKRYEKGADLYRPLGHGTDRAHRILASEIPEKFRAESA